MVIKAGLKLAVAYYRNSMAREQGKANEVSIEEQRRKVWEYAALHGYQIVGEYIDENISGAKDRADFNRMVMDSNKGQWEAILVFHSSRFGRLDSADPMLTFAIGVLRQNNVYVDSATQGITDWNTQEGRMKSFLHSEADNAALKTSTAFSISGREKFLEQGYWVHGHIPYGYDRIYVDDGKELFFKRLDKVSRPRKAHLRLVINKEEADIVRWIFDEWLNNDTSRGEICRKLTARGVPTPSGQPPKYWHDSIIQKILKNRTYKGINRIGDGYGQKVKTKFGKAKLTEKYVAEYEIVDPKTFDDVQKKIKKKRDNHDRVQPSRSSVLTGSLFCAHCGYKLHLFCCKTKYNAYRYFVCSSAQRRPSLGCKKWSVTEQDILQRIARELVKAVDFERLKMVQEKTTNETVSDIAILERHAESLNERIKKATKNIQLLDDKETIRDVQADIVQMRLQKQDTEDKITFIKNARSADGLGEFDKQWDEIKHDLMMVGNPEQFGPDGLIDTADYVHEVVNGKLKRHKDYDRFIRENRDMLVFTSADRWREFFKRINLRVEVQWRQKAAAKRRKEGSKKVYWEVEDVTIDADWLWEVGAVSTHSPSRGNCTNQASLRFRFRIPLRIAR